MPHKPNKYGIKLYVIAEVGSGYCCTFAPYTGANNDPPGQKIFRTVMRLLHAADLFDKGYHLFGDRLYNAPQLVKRLRDQGVLYCGTVNKSQKGT